MLSICETDQDTAKTMDFLWLLLLFLFVGFSTCSIMEKLRQLCPNSEFCTGNRSRSDDLHAGSISCCRECHCDETCYEYEDCCPDAGSVNFQPNNTGKLPCVPAVARNTSFISEVKYPYTESYIKRFRIVNFCPKGYQDNSIVEKCILGSQNAKEYGDVTVVSDVNARIFQNKYCALCHGSSYVLPWHLRILTCSEYLEDLVLKGSEMKDYILNNCLMESIAPDTLAYSSRLFSCLNFEVFSCDYHPDKDVRNGCNHGPYMPYSDTFYGTFISLYKNVFCYLCKKRVEGPNLCLVEDAAVKSPSGGISNLLNLDESVLEKQPNGVCAEDETWDYFKKECTALLCPVYAAVSYGQCRPIFKPSSTSVRLNLLYFLSSSVFTQGPINMYNENVEKYYLRKLSGFYKDANCSLISIFTVALSERDTGKVFAVDVEMTLKLKDNQSLDILTRSLRKRSSTAEDWLLNDMVVTTRGKLDFYDSRYRDNKAVNVSPLFVLSAVRVSEPILKRFFLCPYLALDVIQYRAILSKLDRANGTNGELGTFSPLTNTPSGFYILSKTRVAVCIDTYQRIYNRAGGLHMAGHLPSMLLLVLNVNIRD